MLRAGISGPVVAIVKEVTRPPGATYLAWIRSLAALGSLSAVKVKLADNEDNSSPTRVASIVNGLGLLEQRYRPAAALLEARINFESAPLYSPAEASP